MRAVKIGRVFVGLMVITLYMLVSTPILLVRPD
jgi:hypothetical protein